MTTTRIAMALAAIFVMIPLLLAYANPLTCVNFENERTNKGEAKKEEVLANNSNPKQYDGGNNPVSSNEPNIPPTWRWVSAWLCDPTALFTYLIFIVTTILAISTYGLWNSTSNMADGAITTAADTSKKMGESITEAARAAAAMENLAIATQIQSRAFVFIEKIDFLGEVGDAIRYVTPIWKNGGTTPTRNGRGHTSLWYTEEALGADWDFPNKGREEIEPIVLGPRATLIADLHEVHKDVLSCLRKKSGYLYVWGWIDYNDTSAGTARHRTEFCSELIFDSFMNMRPDGNHVPSQRWSFKTYPRHNGTDDECMKNPQPYVRQI